MERRKFIRKSVTAGISCSCFLGQVLNAKAQDHLAAGEETPCDKKVEFAKKWTSRFFEVLDKNLDEKTRNNIMRQNGEACYRGAHGEVNISTPRSYEEIDKTLREISTYLGEGNPKREGNKIDFHYVRNRRGLKVEDGYCLCPLIENGPARLSPTYCQCSVGYVGQMFKGITGRNVSVELQESLRTGGKSCRFRITFET
jgi:hypothetical protein